MNLPILVLVSIPSPTEMMTFSCFSHTSRLNVTKS